MFKKLSKATYMQIIFVGLVIFISTIALLILGYGISAMLYGMDTTQNALRGSINSVEEISVFKLLQFLNQLSVFIIPVVALAWFIRKEEPYFICFQNTPNINQFVAIILLFVASMPLVQYSLDINSQMQLPASMHSLQEWMREKEDLAANLTNKFMKTTELSSYFVNLLIMAIIPAIGEELLFRGLLTRWISKLTKNMHINIIITSIIFSAFHLQFFGFIPRFLLGMLLGYTYYFTQSIWSSILLHFVNNAMMVTVYFWVYRNAVDVNPDEVGSVHNIYLVIVSAFAIVGILKYIKNQASTNKCFD